MGGRGRRKPLSLSGVDDILVKEKKYSSKYIKFQDSLSFILFRAKLDGFYMDKTSSFICIEVYFLVGLCKYIAIACIEGQSVVIIIECLFLADQGHYLSMVVKAMYVVLVIFKFNVMVI